MPLRPRPLSEINQRSFDYLLRNTDGRVSLLTPGSTARALIETNNRPIDEFNQSLSLYQAMAYVSTATGVYLDLIAELLGITRRPAQAPLLAAEDKAIRFYVPTGFLYTLLPHPTDLSLGLIPSGTTVSTTDGAVIYVVEQDVTFPRTATEAFAPARASVTGTGANVGAFALRQHSLGVPAVLVTNPVSITAGRDTETDEELRARIRDRVRGVEGANEAAIRLAVLSAPGVANIRVVPFKRGAGSFDVLIIPTGNRVTRETFQIAARNLSQTVAFGMHWRLREPVYVRISMIISLSYQGILVGEQVAVRRNVERIVLSHLGNIPIGGELVLTQLGSDIIEAEPRVKDYTIQSLCVNGRPQLIANYQLRSDEIFLADPTLEDPIRVI
jgi:uncharacterized phage protein gp47/JayE